MAPIQPSHRGSKPLKSILKNTSQLDPSSKSRSDNLFATSKKDKRRIKHAQLLSKISKPTAKPKRRRLSKKLVTTLDSLADALPDDVDLPHFQNAAGPQPEQQVNIIKRKSLKSRPGALKRRQKLDNEERERFVKNMAQMTASKLSTESGGTTTTVVGQQPPTSYTSQRWAALRGFIAQTLERRPDTVEMKT
jgi:Ribosome biogenesis protein SLX9